MVRGKAMNEQKRKEETSGGRIDKGGLEGRAEGF